MAGRRAKVQKADGTLTVQCEWFPAAPAGGGRPNPWRRGEECWLETEARLFGGAVRTAFHRLAEGRTKTARTVPPVGTPDATATPDLAVAVEITSDRAAALRRESKRNLQTAFGLNSQYADDAILKANEVMVAQRALIPVEIAETEANRARPGSGRSTCGEQNGWRRRAAGTKPRRLPAPSARRTCA